MIYVAIQFVLFGLLLFVSVEPDFVVPGWFSDVGTAMQVVSVLILLRAIYDLRRSLAVQPAPVADGQLQTRGVYKYIRHPMYLAVWLLFGAGVLVSGSYIKIGLYAVLILFFVLKARHEEQLLLEKYPGYKRYKNTVGAFLPKPNR